MTDPQTPAPVVTVEQQTAYTPFTMTPEVTDPPMSKKALKRQKKQEAYDAARPERLKRRKEQKLAKKVARREAIERGDLVPVKHQRIKQTPSSLRVLIDCAFDDLMTEKEIKSMASQITRCYSENKNAVHPCQILVSSFEKRLAERFHGVFMDQQKSWNRTTFYDNEYLVEDKLIADIVKDDLVYLTADSPDTIQELDESKVYIIGGIVDKNRHKFLCQRKAQQQGIRTARLPIGDYVDMASRKVLTCNHVFEIMSRWLKYIPR